MIEFSDGNVEFEGGTFESGDGYVEFEGGFFEFQGGPDPKGFGMGPGALFLSAAPFQDSGMAKPAIFSDLSSCYPDIRGGRY